MANLYINPNHKTGHINPEIQGHFSEHLGRCIYEGLYVSEDSKIPNVNGMRTDVVEALREIKIPVLRWPGGCFADEYHWKDGIGEKSQRKEMVNTNWGGVVEDNSFGTHEYMELCSQLGCRTYINGNLGSGSVQEMNEWIEYVTLDGVSPMANLRKANGREAAWKLDYFAVGNENWGCGGNMLPEHYADEYRRYQTFVRNYNPDRKIFKIACGPNADDYEWTDTVMERCFRKAEHVHGFMDGLSLHYYTVPGTWSAKNSATDFKEADYYETLRKAYFMDELITRHSAIMDKYDKDRQVGLIVDEWGTWFEVEPGTNPGFLYQQNTIRDALVAGLTLNIFNKHCDRVKMANIAQVANVLQSVVLTDGARMVKTPTYHVFNMYKYHQDGELVESYVETEQLGTDDNQVPNLTESVSADADGRLHITITNQSADKCWPVNAVLAESKIKSVRAEIVAGEISAHNTFEQPDNVMIRAFGSISFEVNRISFDIPASSVMHIEVELAD